MQQINNVATAADYSNALTLGPDNFESLSIAVWNATVAAEFWELGTSGDFQSGAGWGAEILISPSSVTAQRCGGVRFRTNPNTPSTPGRIVATASKSGDPIVAGGIQLTGTLGSGGTVTPAGGMITGIVAGTGAIIAGTGFTVVRNGAGSYTITFTPVLSGIPSCVGLPITSGTGFVTTNSTTPTASTLEIRNSAGAVDFAFCFLAEVAT